MRKRGGGGVGPVGNPPSESGWSPLPTPKGVFNLLIQPKISLPPTHLDGEQGLVAG